MTKTLQNSLISPPFEDDDRFTALPGNFFDPGMISREHDGSFTVDGDFNFTTELESLDPNILEHSQLRSRPTEQQPHQNCKTPFTPISADSPSRVFQQPMVASVEVRGKTALHLGSEKGHSTILKILLNNGAQVDAVDGHGRTALHYGVENGHTEVVNLLLSFGADPKLADSGGLSVLHVAVNAGREDIVQLLVERGVDVNSRAPTSRRDVASVGKLQDC